jgi:hypothetical protein
MEVIDLDILKPAGRVLQIDGKKIEVSFIPVAITFRVDEITRKLYAFRAEDLEKDMKKAEEAFNLSVKLCSLFCEHKYPELDEQWFRNNATVGQVQVFAAHVTQTLTESMQGMERYAKNSVGAKKKT